MPTDIPSPINDERLRRVLARAIGIITRLYPSGTHFVYEPIQNANDALSGVSATADGRSKSISIILRSDEMLVWNNGRPFDEAGIQAICSIGESTKDLTQIGTHGIGFKAVYTCTDQPEIYSGEEHFRIQGGIEPEPITAPNHEIEQLVASGKTVFRLPFKERLRDHDVDRIGSQLETLDKWTLMFLRNLETIEWNDERQTAQGMYCSARQPHNRIMDAQLVELMSYAGGDQRPLERIEKVLCY